MAHRPSIETICRLIDAMLAKKRRCLGVEDAAQLLAVSPRSLQRLLNEEGTSYSDLLDRCRLPSPPAHPTVDKGYCHGTGLQ